jgi:hypothetical protein
MEQLHERLLRIGFAAGSELGLVLAGGYALAAHDLVDRPSQDIDFATGTALPMAHIVERLAAAYEAASYAVEIIEGTPRMARLVVRNNAIVCEVDVLKEAIGPPCHLRVGPVLSLDDAVGLEVRALHERAAHRDFIDVKAANARLNWVEMERWGARHTAGFSLAELADRLGLDRGEGRSRVCFLRTGRRRHCRTAPLGERPGIGYSCSPGGRGVQPGRRRRGRMGRLPRRGLSAVSGGRDLRGSRRDRLGQNGSRRPAAISRRLSRGTRGVRRGPCHGRSPSGSPGGR